jgi:DNA-binding transcriptional MerR regulator
MSEPESPQGKLYTLSEISKKTGISMPTLQRYKKLYQARIPAEGNGRKQRYPESSLPVFDEIRNENLGRRGRPRKDPNAPRPEKSGSKRPAARGRAAAKSSPARSAGGRRAASKRAGEPAPAPAAARGRGGRKAATGTGMTGMTGTTRGGGEKLMTLTQISEQTGISYPTLVRYVRLHAERLPHEGKGRGRRFYPQAVDAFRQLRSESGRGGRKPAAAAKTVGRPAGAARRGRPPGRPPGRPLGRPPGRPAAAAATASGTDAGLHQRLKVIEKAQQSMEKKLQGFFKSLQTLFR